MAYEQMQLKHVRLESGGVADTALNNALIESFCIHARNLDEFFQGSSRFPDTLRAGDFAIESYRYLTNGPIRRGLVNKIKKQIAHITDDRVGADKIDDADRRLLLVVLLAELQNFSIHLKPGLQEVWPYQKELGLSPRPPASPARPSGGR